MYDWGDTSDDLFIISDGSLTFATVWFAKVGTTWYADLTKGGQSLNLGDSNWFGFYFDNGTKYFSYAYTTGSDAYTLNETNTGMTVLVHDADPVP
ncbi:hypothetical protein C6A36_02890, partial [Desulfobacteraceae bacterium SEEP-SAG10]